MQWLAALLVIAATPPAGPPDDPRARGYLGVYMDVQDPTALTVNRAEVGTPAEKAGLQPGDRLMRVGRIAPQNFDEMKAHIESFRPGTALRFEIARPDPKGGPPTTIVATVRLIAQPPHLAAGRLLPE